MPQQRSFDAVFVGGGIVGLSCAWRAAARGARVAVIERASPPAGATNVAAGMLAPVGELTFGEPQLLRLTLAAAALYPGFVDAVEQAGGKRAGYARRGALHIALDRDEAAQLRRVHELQRSLDLDAEWLPPRSCRELEPGLTPSLHGGVFAAGEACVDPRALAGALAAALHAAGGELMNGTEVAGGLFEGERLRGVRIAPAGGGNGRVARAGEEVRAGAVVLCAGAWSSRAEWLAEPARPPVRPVKGQVLELAAAGDNPCERILASERVYIVPRPDGRLVVGATSEEQGFDTTVLAGGVHELLREAYRLLPDVAEMELLDALAGLRPGTPDNLPLIGPGAVDGLYLATGHYRNGILLAPLTADWISASLAGERLPDLAALADPSRPAVQRTPACGPSRGPDREVAV